MKIIKKSALLKVTLLICATSFFAVGCVVYTGMPVAAVGTEIDVAGAPPMPIVEAVPPLPALGLFGLEVPGFGMVVGSGKEGIGTARRVRALFGFRTSMLTAMETMYSFKGGGDEG